MIERILRAGAAVAAGFSIAWEHLHVEPDVAPPEAWRPMVEHACPACGTSLLEGPHHHDQVVVWRTEHDGTVLVTDERGGHAHVYLGHIA